MNNMAPQNISRDSAARRNYNALDLIKLVMALMVVVIHRPLFDETHVAFNYFSQITIAGLAVPFFFACAGFLFYKKWQKESGYTFRYVKRILILYILWSIIYMPCTFVKAFSGHYAEITPRLLAGQAVIFVRDFFLDTSFVQFWYLVATIYGILIFSLLLKKFSLPLIAAGSVALSGVLTALMFFGVAASVVSRVPDAVMNTLRYALPCIVLGALCTGREAEPGRKRGNVVAAVAIAGYFLTDILMFSLYGSEISGAVRNFTKLFAAASVVYIACGYIGADISGRYRTMRSLSTLIYCSHLLLMTEGYRWLAAVTGFSLLDESFPLRFFLTVLFAVSVSFLILRLSRMKTFRFLKYLY